MTYRVDWEWGDLEILFDKGEASKFEALLYFARKGLDVPLGLSEEQKTILRLIDHLQLALNDQKRVSKMIEEEGKII